jgi:pantetheine-phosphate adenylyltransferase
MTRVGFFAGSFDPPTLGHLDLVARARAVVDRLVVGVGINSDKAAWLPVEERLALLRALVPAEVEVVAFDGLAVQAARRAGATLLLRGVRGEADLATELPMALANRRLAPELETLLLVGSPEVAHVSSRLVREIVRSGGDATPFLPPLVAQRLARRPR